MATRSPRRRTADEESTRALMRSVHASRVKPDTELIAIDPGDAHVGVAFFATDDDGGWYCQDAQQIEADDFLDGLAEMILIDRDTPFTVVFEKFRLYADKAKLQTGSEFLTAQMIGVIRYLAKIHNDHVQRHDDAEAAGKMMTCELQGGGCADPADRPRRIEIVKQPADIKRPTTGILRAKKIKSVGKAAKKENKGWGDHCIDAELHGWHYILRTRDGKPSDQA